MSLVQRMSLLMFDGTYLHQIDQYEDVISLYRDAQEDKTMEEEEGDIEQQPQTKHPPSTSGMQPPAVSQAQDPAADALNVTVTGVPIVTHLRFGTPDPPAPYMARNGPVAVNSERIKANTHHWQNKSAPHGVETVTP